MLINEKQVKNNSYPTIPWKIILADDEPDIHRISHLVFNSLTFQGKNCTLLSAYTANETIALLRDNPDTAIVILDMVMENEESGLDVARYVRKSLKTRPIQIMMRTGYPLKFSESSIINDCGIDLIASKPECTAGKLTSSVLSLLKGYDTLKKYRQENRGLLLRLIEQKKRVKIQDEVFHHIISSITSAGIGLWKLDLEKGMIHLESQDDESKKLLPDSLGIAEILNSIRIEDRDRINESFHNHLEGISEYIESELVITENSDIHWFIRGRLSADDGSNIISGVFWKKNTGYNNGTMVEENWYKRIIEGVNDIIFHTDRRGIIHYINPPIYEMTGFRPEELLGKSYTCLILPELKKEIISIHKAQFESGRDEAILEFPLLHSDGSTRWIEGLVKKSSKFNGDSCFQGTLRDITQRKKTEEYWKHMAFHDSLTGLPNRMLLKEKLDHLLALARRHATKIGVLFLDLDNFKEINDTYGHQAGDEVLKAVARLLLDSIREIDIVARFGGDEFVIIIDEVGDKSHVSIIINRIICGFSSRIETGNGSYSVSASIGVALFPDNAQDSSSLIRNADEALYRAKNTGKNICIYC